jgi:small-conductance mechanosensitive channel
MLEIEFIPLGYLYATPLRNQSVDEQSDRLEQQYPNPVLVTGITQNLLTVVSFLVGTTAFILGLTIQTASRLTATMNSYFKTMILALLIPAIVIITYGVIVTASTLDPRDEHYLLLLFSLYVPSGAILFILRKLHSIE